MQEDGTPPVNGFWSLSIYNEHHFFVANPISRFSVGTKNKDLRLVPDGSLTIIVQADEPSDAVERANWLPRPREISHSMSGPIGRRLKSLTARGRHRRFRS